ncbi:phosphotransferase family protein [Bacillus sp. B15-48]|uniref:phosphotransferase n=1 Tax=Bacillus sp. B15-48 TaxID=1548601 RepID=UPI00193FDB39|nr:phosphotransferase [Bacillus sp. B15-48]
MKNTIPIRAGEEIDHDVIRRYVFQHIKGIPNTEIETRQFSSGKSNLTYVLKAGDWEAVLRRPPFGPLAPKAHDMNREYNLLKKVHKVFPYAPEPYVYCDDHAVLGCNFYIMERKNGNPITDELIVQNNLTIEDKRHISTLMVEAMVDLHQIDYKQAGLGNLGYPIGFLERMVNNWVKRYEKFKTDDIPVVDNVTKWLRNHLPNEQEPALIHNDFKLNNVLLSDDSKQITAILDWELATIGDPLFDIGNTLSYWVEENDSELLKESLEITTAQPGFMTRSEFLEAYASKTGRDVSNYLFYLILAYFKIAATQQQIYYRYKSGNTSDPRFARFEKSVKSLLTYANRLIETKTI